MDVSNETVENPGKDQPKWLNIKLLKLINKLFLRGLKQLLKQ